MPRDAAPRQLRDVVFVDGVRTPFGKAGGMYAGTRADDLVIRCIRELLRRNPQLPPERVDEVAIAATTQIGDQGLTIGRTAALLAGLPKTVPGLRHRPDVRRRDDRGDHGRRRASRSAPTTSPSPAASSTWAATRWARASTPTRGSWPRSSSTRPRWSWARPRRTCTTGCPASPRSGPTASASPRRRRRPRRTRDGKLQPDLVTVATRDAEAGWGLATVDEAPRETSLEKLATLKTPFRPHGRVTAGNAAGLNDGATACLLASAEDVAAELGLPVGHAAGLLRLRRRRAGGHGLRPDPVDREGAAPTPDCPSTTSACSS